MKELVENLFKKESSYYGVTESIDSGPGASGLKCQPHFRNMPYSDP